MLQVVQFMVINEKFPYSEKDSVDHPISPLCCNKKSNELMAHSYSHLYDIPSTGLRFFTVYGPWGRPDMAPMIFAKAIVMGEKIKVFNNGNNIRDFTFIDDVVDSVIRCAGKPAEINKSFNSFLQIPLLLSHPIEFLTWVMDRQ